MDGVWIWTFPSAIALLLVDGVWIGTLPSVIALSQVDGVWIGTLPSVICVVYGIPPLGHGHGIIVGTCGIDWIHPFGHRIFLCTCGMDRIDTSSWSWDFSGYMWDG